MPPCCDHVTNAGAERARPGAARRPAAGNPSPSQLPRRRPAGRPARPACALRIVSRLIGPPEVFPRIASEGKPARAPKGPRGPRGAASTGGQHPRRAPRRRRRAAAAPRALVCVGLLVSTRALRRPKCVWRGLALCLDAPAAAVGGAATHRGGARGRRFIDRLTCPRVRPPRPGWCNVRDRRHQKSQARRTAGFNSACRVAPVAAGTLHCPATVAASPRTTAVIRTEMQSGEAWRAKKRDNNILSASLARSATLDALAVAGLPSDQGAQVPTLGHEQRTDRTNIHRGASLAQADAARHRRRGVPRSRAARAARAPPAAAAAAAAPAPAAAQAARAACWPPRTPHDTNPPARTKNTQPLSTSLAPGPSPRARCLRAPSCRLRL